MEFKIAVVTVPPFVNPCWKTCKRAGILFEIIQILCEKYHLSCSCSEFPLSSRANETWDALVRAVHDGVYDTTTPVISATFERSMIVDFSPTIYFVPLIFAIRTPPQSQLSITRLLALNWQVWLCLIACTFVIGVMLTMTEIRKLGVNFLTKVIINTLDTFALFTSQSREMNFFHVGIRILISFWAVSVLVIAGVYSGNLLAFLLKNSLHYPFTDFNTFVECIERKQCQLVVPSASSSFMLMMVNSTGGQYQRISKAFETNHILEIRDLKNLSRKVIDTKDRYLVWITTEPTFSNITNNNEHCQYYTLNSGLSDRYHFPIRKNSTFMNTIHKFTVELRDTGTHRKIYNSYIDRAMQSSCLQDVDEGTPITVGSLLSLLFVLLIGYGLSLCVFAFEKFNENRKKSIKLS